LTNRDTPSVVLEAKVEHNSRRNTVDGAVEYPSFDSKGKYRKGEIRGAFEERMSDKAIVTTFPF